MVSSGFGVDGSSAALCVFLREDDALGRARGRVSAGLWSSNAVWRFRADRRGGAGSDDDACEAMLTTMFGSTEQRSERQNYHIVKDLTSGTGAHRIEGFTLLTSAYR